MRGRTDLYAPTDRYHTHNSNWACMTSSRQQSRHDSLQDTNPADGTASPGLPWLVQIGVAVIVLTAFFFSVSPVAPWSERGATPGSEAESAHRPMHIPEPADEGPPVLKASLVTSQASFADVQVDGEKVYQSRCMSCHQANGQGMSSVFPPLVGTKWVLGDKGRLIRIILNGLSGPIKVNGTSFSGAMPPWKDAMSDEQIAQVATYVRTSWGNDTTAVTTSEVARVRAATKNRSKPWTAKALKKDANMGIPEK